MAASMSRGFSLQAATFCSQHCLPRHVNLQTINNFAKCPLRVNLNRRKTHQNHLFCREMVTKFEGRVGMSKFQQQRNVKFISNHFTSLRRQQNNFLSSVTLLSQRHIITVQSPAMYSPNVRRYSSESEQENDDQSSSRRKMKLMDFQEIVWPSPFKSIRNYFFSFLISSYFDRTFSIKNFLIGAEQAVEYVSRCISNGNFDSLNGLVAHEAIREIRNSYADMDDNERHFISVKSSDFYFKYVFEIGMIFDDDTNKRFVEITAVFQGFPGFEDLQEESGPQYYQHISENQRKVYICNYRFIREFTKGVESEWTINKLNHFSPIDVPVRF